MAKGPITAGVDDDEDASSAVAAGGPSRSQTQSQSGSSSSEDETSGDGTWPPETYRVPEGHFDEVRDGSGSLRPVWRTFVEHAGDLGDSRLARAQAQAAARIRENGVTYNVHEAGGPGTSRAWTVDALPFLMSAAEWEPLASGLRQRARLLEAMAADFYGERRLVAEGFVPPALVVGHPDFARAVVDASVAGGVRLHQVAFDLGRGPDGVWRVIGTRTQNPSGAGYALENRLTVSRIFAEAFRESHVHMLARFFRALQNRLREGLGLAGRRSHVVLLTPGPFSETYFEHAYLARYLGFTLAEGADLLVREDKVWLRTLSGLEPVAGVLRRLDDDFCDPLEMRSDSTLGIAGLVGAWRAGNVVLANAFGAGVLESPGLYGFLPPLCRHLLGEPLETASVATWWCGEAAAFADALADPSQLVLKPAFSGARIEPVFLGDLDEEEVARKLEEASRRPEEFVLQERLPLSHVPVWTTRSVSSTTSALESRASAPESRASALESRASALESRAMMLRVFLVSDGRGDYRVMPGGLARIAGPDGAVVSGQRGGSSKDTWVLSDGPVERYSLLAAARAHGDTSSARRGLSSRTGENLFWFGRYAERAENRARLLRSTLTRLLDAESFPEGLHGPVAECCRIDGLLGPLRDGALPSLDDWEDDLLVRVFAPASAFGIAHDLAAAARAAGAARERLSSDSWRLVSELPETFVVPPSAGFADVMSVLDRLIVTLAAVAGLETERMLRDDGWRVVALGRNIERLASLASSCLCVATSPEVDEPALLEWLLDLSDASVTYRARHRSLPEWPGVADLLLHDETNPRSAAWLLDKLADHTRRLPEAGLGSIATSLASMARKAADARGGSLFRATTDVPGFLQECRGAAFALSDELAARYFRHVHDLPHSTAGM